MKLLESGLDNLCLRRIDIIASNLGVFRENTANVKLNISNKVVNLGTTWAKVIFPSFHHCYGWSLTGRKDSVEFFLLRGNIKNFPPQTWK